MKQLLALALVADERRLIPGNDAAGAGGPRVPAGPAGRVACHGRPADADKS